MTITAGALLWPMAPDCDAASLNITPTQWADAQARAIERIWALSGRFYGTRLTQYRPQTLLPSGCCDGWPPYLVSIYGSGWPFSDDPRSPDPTYRKILELPRPAVSVAEVQVEGDVVDPVVYRLEGDYLVRQDGGQWPASQDMIAALGSANTWAVTYSRGVTPPAEGQYAAGVLACELGKQIAGGKCRLAFNATTVTRAGVTINRDILMAARTTGVTEVDQWVATVNPQGLQREPSVWSPDTRRNAPLFAGSTVNIDNWAPIPITGGDPIDGGGPGDPGDMVMDGGGP
jgi:hypothetical protein